MKTSPPEDIELIERYFDNELSPAEADGLKQRLTTDAGLRKLFEREKLLIDAVRLQAAGRDLAYLKDLETTLSKKETGSRKAWYYLAAAATVSILVLVLWNPWSAADPGELYAAHFQPHPNVFEPIVRGETTTSTRTLAFLAYEQKDYARAATLFAEVLSTERDAGMLMLLGNARLMTGDTEEAQGLFRSLITDYDELDTAGKWYLSLTHVRLGQIAQAKALLMEIANARSPYAAKARDLLKDLD